MNYHAEEHACLWAGNLPRDYCEDPDEEEPKEGALDEDEELEEDELVNDEEPELS